MNENKQDKRVNELMEKSMNGLSDLMDANSVIGTPIVTTSGWQIIPVSKVTVGYLSGGSDIGVTKVIKEDETVPFAGGGGAVVSMRPAGFIVDDGKECRFMHAGEDPLDNLMEKASDLLRRFQGEHA